MSRRYVNMNFRTTEEEGKTLNLAANTLNMTFSAYARALLLGMSDVLEYDKEDFFAVWSTFIDAKRKNK
jgi:hypothetical protein